MTPEEKEHEKYLRSLQREYTSEDLDEAYKDGYAAGQENPKVIQSLMNYRASIVYKKHSKGLNLQEERRLALLDVASHVLQVFEGEGERIEELLNDEEARKAIVDSYLKETTE